MSQHGPPVLIGNPGDDHVAAVADEIRERGGEPVILDTERLRADGYRLTERGLTVGPDSAGRGSVVGGGRGWLRRLAPPGWSDAGPPTSHDGVVRASWLALLVGWAHTAGVEWLTALPQLLRAENKLAQLATARALGIDVPRTLSTSSTEVVHHVLGSRILVKPLGPGQYLDETGEEVMVPATILNSTDLGPEVGTCPFLFQEPLLARRHLRVVTVHDQAWATALPAEGLPVDWRLADHAHDGFVPADDPTTDRARAAAVRLASQLDVRFSSQDWIDTGDRLVFLDLNPAGQWLFLPEAVSAAVTESIAGWLGGDL